MGESYLSPKFINGFLPFLILLLPFTTISFRKYKKEISNHKARFGTFLLIFVPVIAMVIFTISKKFEFSLSFFLPLAGALIVGVNEELVYRGVVLTNFADEKGRMRGLFLSAIAFSLLNAVNILGGLSVSQVISQLITTFLAGFYGLIYMETKNIGLLAILHGLWDYIFLSEITKAYPLINSLILALVLVQVLASLVLIIRHKKFLSGK